MNAPRQVTYNPTVAWTTWRIAVLLTAISLAAYIPYKYASQLHALTGLYAFLFPLSGILAFAGIILAVKPHYAFSIPLTGRIGIGTLATLWMVTGVLCVPSLMERVATLPAQGLFALFHMLTQHVFLSLSVSVFVLAPHSVYARFGLERPHLPPHAAQDTPLSTAKGMV